MDLVRCEGIRGLFNKINFKLSRFAGLKNNQLGFKKNRKNSLWINQDPG